MVSSLLLLGLSLVTVSGQLKRDSKCGDTIGCYYKECNDRDNLCFLLTWQDNPGANSADFTLSLKLEPGAVTQWVAVGFSRDELMGDDSVVDCAVENQAGSAVNCYLSYNVLNGKSNIRLENPPSGVLTGIQGSVADGVLTAKFTRTYTAEAGSPDADKIFDLREDFHLLVANGQMTGLIKDRHSITDLPSISSKADLQSNLDLSGSVKFKLVKAHGALMMAAWILCASIGIVLARYFKPMWPEDKLCGEKVWFSCHRVFMILAFLCCAAAFIIIFVDVDGWSELPGASRWQKAHPIIGVVVMFFALLNPIMALFRPHPDGEYRFIFNWCHWFVGTSAHVLAMLNLILGVTFAKAGAPDYLMWILVGFAAYQFLYELVLELHECGIVQEDKSYKYQEKPSGEPVGSTFKRFMLGIHIMIIVAITVVCIVLLAIN